MMRRCKRRQVGMRLLRSEVIVIVDHHRLSAEARGCWEIASGLKVRL